MEHLPFIDRPREGFYAAVRLSHDEKEDQSRMILRTHRENQEFFERNRAELAKNYSGSYVAIRNRRVVASGPDFIALCQEAQARWPDDPIYIDDPTKNPEGDDLPY